MRPSWPPPRMPSVAPGAMIVSFMMPPRGVPRHFRPCACRHRSSRPASASSLSASTAAARSAALTAPARPDRQRAHRYASGHLHDREQRILPRQRLRFHRYAEDRQGRQRRGHARQMRRPARAGDDHLEPRRARVLRELIEPLGRTVRGDDAGVPCAIPSASSVSAAWRIVAQSDWLPIDDRHGGLCAGRNCGHVGLVLRHHESPPASRVMRRSRGG